MIFIEAYLILAITLSSGETDRILVDSYNSYLMCKQDKELFASHARDGINFECWEIKVPIHKVKLHM
jgi:hypothetical protein